MKRIIIYFLAATFFISCKKGDTGPEGLQGEPGPQGPQGIMGNANVREYTYGSHNFATSFAQYQVTTTQDTMNRSTWLVYIFYQSLSRWYFLPGAGVGGATMYRVSMGYANGKVNIYIDRSGPGETYSQAKVIRIYNTFSGTGGRSGEGGLPDIDFSDYYAVKEYYGL